MRFSTDKNHINPPARAIVLGIILPSVVPIVLFGLLVFAVLLPAIRSTIINQKRENIRQLTESAWKVLDSCGRMEKSGELTAWEAREQAKQIIGNMQYGKDGLDYFWVQDMVPRMIVHPYRPDIVGQDVSDIMDSHGLPLFGQMAHLVEKQGEGFISYYWQYKNNPLSFTPKLSYVKGYAPWGWIIGTGVYVDDLHTEVNRITGNLIWWSLGILVMAILLMVMAIKRNLAAERQRLDSESALEDTWEKYRILAENMTDVVWALDLNTKRLSYISPSVEHMLGYSVHEAMADAPFSLTIPESQHTFMEALSSALDFAEKNPGAPYTDTMVLQEFHKNGSVVGLEVSAALTYDEKLRPHLAVGTIRNVTARMRAEKALRANEARFRAMTENSADVILVLDHSLKPIYVSPSVKFFGWTPEEVLSQGYKGFIHPDDVRELAGAVSTAARTPEKPARMNGIRVRRKDGSYAFIQGLMTYLPDTPGVDGFLVNGMDVTDRKMAEEALERNENLYRGLFENSGAATVVFGDDGIVSMCNSEFSRLTGYSRDQIVGQMHWSSFFHPDEVPRLQGYHRRRSLGLLAPKLYEIRVLTRGGEVRHTYNRVAMVEGTNDRISSLLDITDLVLTRKEKERLEGSLRQSNKMEAIGALAGGIAHDFNNILFPILGFTEMALEQAAPDDPNRENLDEILKATLRAKALVSQILTFSRQTSESLKPVRLKPILEDVLSLIRATVPSYVKIRQHLDKDCGVVFADPNQIHQVAMNLCTNAFQAMRENGGELKVSLGQVDLKEEMDQDSPSELPPGKYVRLSVSDTGPGMSQDVLDHLFEPYFTTKAVGEGTGMGLATAHGIIRKHGGAIRVRSRLGEGSRFDVHIPAVVNNSDELKENETGPAPTGSGHVLLVDDEVQVLELTYQMLKKLGYTVTAQVSSAEALSLFRDDPYSFDLVLTDMTMPDMTGDKLAEAVMHLRPEIPVILCTGFSERLSREEAGEIGISDYILKPVIMKHLAEVVYKAMNRNTGN
ncbi:MAG: PAS domain S-box protein [Desulfatibacillum sp.]|nr:PAS domain S-box protein [Desulfatibacillum sp.]